MAEDWELGFVTIPFILSLMTIAAVTGLFFASFMASEEDTVGEWFTRDILRRGTPRDERERKKKQAARMERLLNGR
jgi:hypothetical protein